MARKKSSARTGKASTGASGRTRKAPDGEASTADAGKEAKPRAPKDRAVADGDVESKSASKPKKKAAPKERTVKAREFEKTLEARKAELDRLPSLDEHPVALRPGDLPDEIELEADATRPATVVVSEPAADESFIDRGLPIPDTYGYDRVLLMPRDPHWMYAYWDLQAGGLERLRFQYTSHVIENARWVLQVNASHDHRLYHIDIDLDAKGWWLRATPSGRYSVQLGFLSPEGRFESLCKSNEASMPCVGVSPVIDEQWMIVRRDLEELLDAGSEGMIERLKSGAWSARASESWQTRPRSDWPRAHSFFSGTWLNPKDAAPVEDAT